MSQTIRRKAHGVRRAAAAQGAKQKVSQAKARSGSALDAAMRWLPFTEEQWHHAFLALIIGGAVAVAWTVASMAGLPALASARMAQVAADAGFEVRRVEVHGVERLNELKVYELALAERDRAMTQVDIARLRADLLGLSWVEDARVSRQLPDTLVIDIVERKPFAVLAKPGRLVLIDATGHPLEPVSAARAKGMLRISGPGAARQVEELTALLASAPALRPRVAKAEWKGNRRWDVAFDTGQILALPEGDEAAAKALMAFARMDGVNRMLGGQVAIFDMRAPDRIYLRVPGRAEQKPPVPKAAGTTTAATAAATATATEEKH